MRRRHLLAVLLPLILIGAGLLWWLPTPPAAPDIGRGVDRNNPIHIEDLTFEIALPAPELASLDASPPSKAAAAPAMPPEGTPLVEMFAELDARARRGEPAAACRLGAELARCARLGSMLRWAPDSNQEIRMIEDSDGSESQVAAMIENVVASDRLREEAARVCADVEALNGQSVARYFAMAAKAGHLPSMIEYVSGAHLTTRSLMQDPALITDFRRDAPGLLERILASGELGLLRPWLQASALPDNSPMLEILPTQWRSMGFVVALINEFPAEHRRLIMQQPEIFGRFTATPEDQVAARRLYQDHFANTPAPAPKSPGSADNLDWLRELLSIEHYRCEDPPL